MNYIKHDIKNKSDIELMVREFYKSLLTNESIKPVFAHTDFETHMPHMIGFWSFVLLDEEGYTTNVFEKHLHLPIKEPHFDIWLKHFEETVTRLFSGENADKAITRAQTIAYTFKMKLKGMGRI